jgi:murein DD-endopeptidase MepM/ murein hydrolase activator NlpD
MRPPLENRIAARLRRRPLLAPVALAMAIIPVAVAADGLGLLRGAEKRAPAPADPASEVRLDELAPAEARRRGGRSRVKRRATVVQLVSPGGRVEERARQEGPPRHILEENARLRRELKHLEALEAARRRVSRALAGTGAIYDGPLRLGAGGLAWPVAGPIVSPFGQRWGRLHAGVDIAAPAGTVIRAAAAGGVVIRGPVGGYGNYVCVQHSTRLTSCYAHLSRFLTYKGAAVRQGEAIGLVGCTGHCFGDHVHFETWVEGRPVDPMRYL